MCFYSDEVPTIGNFIETEQNGNYQWLVGGRKRRLLLDGWSFCWR
jgi:hypothetical protein